MKFNPQKLAKALLIISLSIYTIGTVLFTILGGMVDEVPELREGAVLAKKDIRDLAIDFWIFGITILVLWPSNKGEK